MVLVSGGVSNVVMNAIHIPAVGHVDVEARLERGDRRVRGAPVRDDLEEGREREERRRVNAGVVAVSW